MKNKADNSLYVHERDKLKDKLLIKDLKWTERQQEFIRLALDKNTRVIFISGPAGTSKSILSIYAGLKLLSDKRISEIIYIRSAVESSDSKIGFLPGDMEDKFRYYNMPLLDKLDELLPKAQVDALLKDKRVVTHPTNFSRGMSWAAKCIILDEAQNSTSKEIVTILTRLGEFSRLFILADPSQTDLHNGKRGGFQTIVGAFSDEESKEMGIHSFTFTREDIVRSRLVKFIVGRLEDRKIG